MPAKATKASKVYFADTRSRAAKESKIAKIAKLFKAAGFAKLIDKEALIAVKLHFGEKGNDSHINPVFVRRVADAIKAAGGKPFLTDANTLYSGSRFNAVDHLVTAIEHGFGFAVTGAPLIVCDGLKGGDMREIPIKGKHFKKVKIAASVADADAMIVMSHFKGHEMAGFGGAIKNLAMGCAPAAGKRDQHSPRFAVDGKACIGCAECFKVCPAGAVTVKEKKANIDKAICIGCGECMTVCKSKAISIDWATDLPPFTERMVEYALGAVKAVKGQTAYFNFALNITPDCDCCSWSDAPIVPDVGILASLDPVALDQACYDLVNNQRGLAGAKLAANFEPGQDKFKGVWSYTHGEIQLSYGESLGLGSRVYELVVV
jgi:hypothetical protein